MDSRRRISLVLAAGGANGDFQAGFLYGVRSLFPYVKEIAAASVGVINSIAVAQNEPEILKVWLEPRLEKKILKGSGVFGAFIGLLKRTGVYNSKGIESLFKEYVTAYSIPVSYQTVNIFSGDLITHHAEGQNVNIKSMVNSLLMPGVWANKEGEYDGGIYNPIPFDLATDGAETIVVENYPGFNEIYSRKGLGILFKDFMRLERLGQMHSRTEKLNTCLKLQETLPNFKVVKPIHHTGNFLDFSLESRRYGFNLGLEYATKFLKSYEKGF